MDRSIFYAGQIPLSSDVLFAERAAMIAIGNLVQMMIGTNTIVDGLAVTQTSVPSLSISVGPGRIITNSTVDATAYGALAADSTDALMKMGINIASTTLGPFTAPVTNGQSVNILIGAAFSEADSGSAVLQYYNAANPSLPFSGPANNLTAQNTRRLQTVALTSVVGVAAATGTQADPAMTGGYSTIARVTIAYGATSIVNANITAILTSVMPFKFNASTLGTGLVASNGVLNPNWAMNYVSSLSAGLAINANQLQSNWQLGYSSTLNNNMQLNAGTLGASPATILSYNTTSGSFVVPAGCRVIKVTAVGAGGPSGAIAPSTLAMSGAGGGGAYFQGLFNVQPGDTITITPGVSATPATNYGLSASGGSATTVSSSRSGTLIFVPSGNAGNNTNGSAGTVTGGTGGAVGSINPNMSALYVPTYVAMSGQPGASVYSQSSGIAPLVGAGGGAGLLPPNTAANSNIPGAGAASIITFGASGGALQGGSGSPGLVIIEG